MSRGGISGYIDTVSHHQITTEPSSTNLETLAGTDALDELLELAALLERGCRHIVSNLPGMEDRGKVTYSRS